MRPSQPKGQRKWRRQLPTEAFMTQQESSRLMIGWYVPNISNAPILILWILVILFQLCSVKGRWHSTIHSLQCILPQPFAKPGSHPNTRTARHRKAVQRIKAVNVKGASIQVLGQLYNFLQAYSLTLSDLVVQGKPPQRSFTWWLGQLEVACAWQAQKRCKAGILGAPICLSSSPPSVCHMFPSLSLSHNSPVLPTVKIFKKPLNYGCQRSFHMPQLSFPMPGMRTNKMTNSCQEIILQTNPCWSQHQQLCNTCLKDPSSGNVAVCDRCLSEH